MKDISIIIVNYNTKDFLLGCLASIYQNNEGLSIEVIVVDNNSSDGAVEQAETRFPGALFIKNKVNSGFASANNQAIEHAKGKYILLLNPDTIVKSGAIRRLYDFMEVNPGAGIAGCRIINGKGAVQFSVGRFPTLFRVFNQSIGTDKLFCRIPLLNNYAINLGSFKKDREVDWLTGACLIIRKKAVEQIGLFDGKYFLYFEEVDFCLRAKKAGWKVFFIPGVTIVHYLAQSTGKNLSRTVLEFYRSNYLYFQKNCSANNLLLLREIINTGIVLRIIIWRIILLFTKKKKNEARERIIAYKTALKSRFSKRIAINTTASSSWAGVGHYTSHLMHYLAKSDSGKEYVFLGCSRNLFAQKLQFLNKAINYIIFLIHEYLFLPVRTSMKDIEVLHSTAYELPLLAPKKSVVTIHDMAFWLFPEKFPSFYQLRLKLMVPIAARRAKMIITDSAQSKKDISRILKIKPEKIEVVYLGVEHDKFKPIGDQGVLNGIRKEYNLGNAPFILFVGTLEPRKNIVNLITAFSCLKKDYGLEHKLVLVGRNGWLYEEIFKAVEKFALSEEIIFVGYVPDNKLPIFYNAASLFAYLSLYEGFGLPVLEAMACGTPVVTTNTSSLPELVADAALMVDPCDIPAITKAMYNALTDQSLRAKFIRRGLLRAQDFSWKKTVENTEKVYDLAFERGKPEP